MQIRHTILSNPPNPLNSSNDSDLAVHTYIGRLLLRQRHYGDNNSVKASPLVASFYLGILLDGMASV